MPERNCWPTPVKDSITRATPAAHGLGDDSDANKYILLIMARTNNKTTVAPLQTGHI